MWPYDGARVKPLHNTAGPPKLYNVYKYCLFFSKIKEMMQYKITLEVLKMTYSPFLYYI